MKTPSMRAKTKRVTRNEEGVSTLAQVAEKIGVSRQALLKLRARYPEAPAALGVGREDVEAWMKFYPKVGTKKSVTEARNESGDDRLEKNEIERRLKLARMKAAEMDVARMEGRMVPLDDLLDFFPHLIGTIFSAIGGYDAGARFGGMTPGAINKEWARFLGELSESSKKACAKFLDDVRNDTKKRKKL